MLRGDLVAFRALRYLFEVDLQRDGDVVPDFEGAVIRPRPDTLYFDIPIPKMTRSWQQGWFYSPDLPS